jgi:hypothetical protein
MDVSRKVIPVMHRSPAELSNYRGAIKLGITVPVY